VTQASYSHDHRSYIGKKSRSKASRFKKIGLRLETNGRKDGRTGPIVLRVPLRRSVNIGGLLFLQLNIPFDFVKESWTHDECDP